MGGGRMSASKPIKGHSPMPDWKEYTDDTILNSMAQPGSPAEAQLQRILQYRATQATVALTDAVRAAGSAVGVTADNLKAGADEVSMRLQGVMATIHTAAQLTEQSIKSFRDGIDRSLRDVSGVVHSVGKSQGRQQAVLIVLTFVLAAATVAYSWTTWLLVQETRSANRIQQQVLELQAEAARTSPPAAPSKAAH
jgi:hypothetical protein